MSLVNRSRVPLVFFFFKFSISYCFLCFKFSAGEAFINALSKSLVSGRGRFSVPRSVAVKDLFYFVNK